MGGRFVGVETSRRYFVFFVFFVVASLWTRAIRLGLVLSLVKDPIDRLAVHD
jgi:hypothetical protein